MKLIKGGKVHTVTKGIIAPGDVLIRGDKIAAVCSDIAVPEGAEVIDARGKEVFPGVIDCHTHLGLDEEGYWENANELNEMGDPSTPHLRAVDGFYPADRAIAEAVAAGVTAAITTTGSIQVISGQAAAVKLVPGARLKEMLLCFPVGIKGGFGENPKRYYQKLGVYPNTRMGIAAVMRQALADACSYRAGWRPEVNTGKGKWSEEAKLLALQPLLAGEIPWRVHAHRADDIMTALRIAAEFDIRVVIEHATEAPLVAEELAAAGVPVVLGPGGFVASTKQESVYPTIENLELLVRAGVLFSFTTDHPIIPLASLPLAAAKAIRYGLAEELALKALTINAATIMGLEHRIGSIETGKDADIVVASGSLFDQMTEVETVLINGNYAFRKNK